MSRPLASPIVAGRALAAGPARSRAIVPALLAGILAATGCDDAAGPVDAQGSTVQPAASVVWNAVTDTVISRTRPFSPQAAQRVFAYVSLAQHAAAALAEERRAPDRPSERAAVAGASAVVLAELFPQQAAYVDGLLRAQERASFEEPGTSFAAGETVGREIGAKAVALSRSDGFGAQWAGTVPSGPGVWFSTAKPPAPPLFPVLGQMRPFVMSSGSEFRPAPPPRFGSPEFQTALAEIRHIADTRTAAQDSLAQFWAMNAGSFPPGFWNATAARLITEKRLSEGEAARTLAIMNAAGMDALIASHEAKFTYWLLRPSQADPEIRMAIPLPNFPSYPSNHAALSRACAEVLASAFPQEREKVLAAAEDAAISRLYGGIHYRFDAVAGLELGRRIAERALDADRGGALLAGFR